MYGGAVERRYRRLRPDVEELPWGALAAEVPAHEPRVIEGARRIWTEAAFQEHRTGAACAEMLQALIAARAPLDLIALASRFPLDEMAHVEVCARLVGELGGAVCLMHDPDDLYAPADVPTTRGHALLRAAEHVVRGFCVGEALSIPVLRASWHEARQPLVHAALGLIVKDEAAHGQLGWLFLDWAAERLTEADRAHLGGVARQSIEALRVRWRRIEADAESHAAPHEARALGWMEPRSYLQRVHGALQSHVVAPLEARGIAAS